MKTIKPLRLAAISMLISAGIPAMAQTEEGSQDRPLPDPVPGIEISGTLPVCYINTTGGIPITSKEEYLTADFWIDPLNTGYEALGSAEEPIPLNIRGRGNTSWTNWNKKPYRLKFDSKQTPFGMPKSKHFGLLSHAPTQLYMQNATSFEIGNLLDMDWNPRSVPVEVVLNGLNVGVYSFSELVKIDVNRINIPEQPDNNEDDTTLESGWLVEIDNTDDIPQIKVPLTHLEEAPDETNVARFTLKTPEELSAKQEEWITNQLTTITRSLYNPDRSDLSWIDMVDLESMAKYYIAQELSCNLDAFVGSTYFYKGEDKKWKFGPMWDNEWTFVTDNRTSSFWGERAKLNNGKEYGLYVWIKEAMQFPQFLDEVKRVWNDYYPEKIQPIYTFIDNFYEKTKVAYENNALIWPEDNHVNIHAAYENTTRCIKENIRWFDSFVNSGFNAIDGITPEYTVSGEGWFTIEGIRLPSEPSEKGIYIHIADGKSFKVIK